MRKFLLKLRVRGCEKVFKEGLGPGVIALKEIAFDAEPYEGALAVALVREKDLLVQEIIVVQIEEISVEVEVRRCNECGEEWPDDGSLECFFCGSEDTEIVMDEEVLTNG